MIPGSLYEIRHKWLLPRNPDSFWRTHDVVMYLRPDKILRSDGHEVINHLIMAGGEIHLVDRTFLKFLEPVNETA